MNETAKAICGCSFMPVSYTHLDVYKRQSNYYAVRQALDMNDLLSAERILINAPDRDAEWFFLSGVLSYKKGFVDDGLSNIRQAMNMDSNNMEYRRIYQQMLNSGMAS